MPHHEGRLPSRTETALLKALLEHPDGLTRQEIAAATGLTASTVNALLRGEHGLRDVLAEGKADRAGPGGGPRPKILRLRRGIYIAGIEIGHGHVRVGIADLRGRLLPARDGERAHYTQVPRRVFWERLNTLNWIAGEPGGEPGALPRRLEEVFRHNDQGAPGALEKPLVLAVGVSVAGSVDPTNGRLLCARTAIPTSPVEGNIAYGDWDGESAGTGLRDRLRHGDQSDLLGWTATRFRSIGAANLCAQAELHDGELERVSEALFLKWTGEVSAAVVIGGSVYTGHKGLAGGLPRHAIFNEGHSVEFGKPSGEQLSVAAGIRRLSKGLKEELDLRPIRDDELLRDYFRSEVLSIAHGDRGTKEQVAAAKRRLAGTAKTLGEAVAPSVEMLNPARVLIGGGAFEPRDWPIVAEYLLEGLRNSLVAPGETPRVELAAHTDHPALHGAVISRLNPDHLVPTLLTAADAAVRTA